MDVTITAPGCEPVHTTTEAIKEAADRVSSARFAKDQLKAIIERIERLEEEKKTISDDDRVSGGVRDVTDCWFPSINVIEHEEATPPPPPVAPTKRVSDFYYGFLCGLAVMMAVTVLAMGRA